MFTQPAALTTLRNTIIWTVLVPLLSTGFGLAYAVFIDKARGEKVLKALVFMPMAISFVGAGIIWKLVYDYRGPAHRTDRRDQRNTRCPRHGPQTVPPGRSGKHHLPHHRDGLDSDRVRHGDPLRSHQGRSDGTRGGGPPGRRQPLAAVPQRHYPGIRGALVVVLTTITIATLKVFDIVRTMTAGNYNTSVIANEMYTQAFRAGEPGRGAALALVLFLLVLPIVVYNARVLRQQREIR